MTHNDIPESMLQRHRAFWEMEDVDAPLMNIGRYTPLQPRQPFLLADGSPVQDGDPLLPDSVDARLLAKQPADPVAVASNGFIHGRSPYDMCWTEAIAGCPISWKAGYVWSDPFLESPHDVERLKVSPDNPWLTALQKETRLLVERAAGRYPITQPLLRGPVDIASGALGDEPFCWAMVDEPEPFRRLLETSTDVFLAAAETWRDAVPLFKEGSCAYGIWAPGTTVRMQADNAALMSPQLYREFLSPCDERICAAFDYPLIHTHSGVLNVMVDALLDLDPLRAIQVSLDYPAPPSVDELLPILKQANAHKPLIITGAVTQRELDTLLQELSHRGLCLQVGVRDE